MSSIEQTLDDGTVVRMSNPVPPLPPFVRYVILTGLYRNARKRRLNALKSAWKNTTFFTWITLQVQQPR